MTQVKLVFQNKMHFFPNKMHFSFAYITRPVFSMQGVLKAGVHLFLVLIGTSIVLSIMHGCTNGHCTLLVILHTGSIFLTSSATLASLCLFYNNHSNRCEMIFHLVLISVSLMIIDIEYPFQIPVGQL